MDVCILTEISMYMHYIYLHILVIDNHINICSAYIQYELHAHTHAHSNFLTLLQVYLMASGVNRAQNFYARPRSLRMTWYGLMGTFGAAMWVLLKVCMLVLTHKEPVHFS